jgi:hypothetical protein
MVTQQRACTAALKPVTDTPWQEVGTGPSYAHTTLLGVGVKHILQPVRKQSSIHTNMTDAVMSQNSTHYVTRLVCKTSTSLGHGAVFHVPSSVVSSMDDNAVLVRAHVVLARYTLHAGEDEALVRSIKDPTPCAGRCLADTVLMPPIDSIQCQPEKEHIVTMNQWSLLESLLTKMSLSVRLSAKAVALSPQAYLRHAL